MCDIRQLGMFIECWGEGYSVCGGGGGGGEFHVQ